MRYHQNSSQSDIAGSSHGVFLRNAHGLEAIFGNKTLTWRTIGGSVDLYFLDGPTPRDVTQQYTNGIVGLPAMQQYWTFGLHQCHWGYQNRDEVQSNVDNYRNAGIPLETAWVDIDYMDAFADFTTDPVNFPAERGQQLINNLHNNSQHFVPIVDSGIWWPGSLTNYTTYNLGHKLDVFIKNPDGTEYVGKVWPGNAVWADWHYPAAGGWWADEITRFYQQIEFDGIWIDMSELSSFCEGSCGTSSPQAEPVPSGERNINYPPYAINNIQGPLNSMTIAVNATHVDGVVEYDVHNSWGHGLLNATYHGLRQAQPNKRPFIIGRSTFASSGKWAGHWGGDNWATWQMMYWSIPQGLTMSLFGIPMFGVDTCGIAGDVSSELCGRWMQLSALFPFYRNHYARGEQPREPWSETQPSPPTIRSHIDSCLQDGRMSLNTPKRLSKSAIVSFLISTASFMMRPLRVAP